MARWSVSSLRARLITLVLLAVIPAWGLIFYGAWVERREEAGRARDEAVRLSRFSAAQFQGVFEATGRLLVMLAEFDAVRRGDAAGCSALLARLLPQYPEYVNLGAAWPNGDVFCIAPPFAGRLNVGDRPSFRVALETRELTIGELQASRTTGKPVLVLRHPIVDPAGRVRLVVNAVMDLARLNVLVTEVGLPSGAALLLLSSDGRLLARYPDPEKWVERATSDPTVAHAILANRAEGVSQAVGVDGVLRLYGFTPLSAPRRAEGLYASVGIPVGLAFAQANRNLARNLAWLGVVTLLALAAAWVGGGAFILSPVRALVRATERLAAGDLGARAGLGEGRGELSQLARAFDNMAGAIERHLADRQRAQARLAKLNECLLSFGPDPRENINRLVACCGEQLGAACALYNRLEDGKLCAWGQWNVPPDFNPVDTPDGHICFDVIRGDRTEPWVISNLPQTAYAHTDPTVLRYGLRTYMGKAVAFGDTFVGSLCMLYREDRVPSEEEIKLLGIVASAIGVEEKRKQAEERLAERTQQLEAVRTVSEEITRELDLTTVLDLITRRAMDLVRASSAVLRLWQEETGLLVPQSRVGVEESRGTGTLSLRLGEGVAGAVAQRRQGLIVNDFRHSPHATPALLARTTHAAVLSEPLLYRDRLVGVINLNQEDPGRPFKEEDRQLLALFAAQAAVAIENARLYADLKQAYEKLQRAQEELVRAEKLRALGQMAAGIAHDLNNVLAAILAHIELLRLQVQDPRAQERLAMLETTADDGSQIVRRLQGFARQQPTGLLVPCDLAALVQEVVEITRPRWRDGSQRRGAMIEMRVGLSASGELPPILGQPAEIREVLTNLILNAVDAMPDGGALTLAGNATPDGVTLTVTDTGVGMSEDVRRQIFDPFFTTKGGQGSGLGLSVVYAIMQRHGGRIDVASSPGEGTTFTLRFRRSPDVVPPEGETPPLPGPRRRILLIDDNPAVCQTVASLLRTAGHTVMEANGGAAGLAIFAESPVDVVLTDLGMSDVNGWDVARVVKGRDPRVPVILLTGWGEQPIGDGGESASDALVDRVIAKPFRLRELLAAIAELAGSSSEQRGANHVNP